MKNKLYNIVISGLAAIFLCSCYDSLDRELRTTLTKEQVEKEYEYTRYQAMSLYTDLEEGFFALGNAMRASACDEAEYTYKGGAETFNSGSWNAFNNPDDVWAQYFKAIRKVNVYLDPNKKPVNLDAYKNDPSENSQAIYKTRMEEIANWSREARFLRAFYYFELIKRYGGVPLFTEALNLDTDFGTIQRNSLEDCIKFIVDECDDLSDDENGLPVTYDEDNLGRVTKGAALALKSRVLLYAASDLWNNQAWTGGYAHPELISLPNGDNPEIRKERWKAAADAAKAVIDLSGEAGYNLGSNYASLGKTFEDPELIMVRRSWAKNDFERLNFPIGYPNGEGGITPSQNLVDAYEMTDGSSFDWNNNRHKSEPYFNRDPRLAMTIYTNEAAFKDTHLECWAGGKNGKGVANATTTGYYLHKFIDEDLDLAQGRTSIHTWIFFRISEMYLNYAEALNEYDPGNADIAIYASKTRGRNGVNMPPFPSTLSQTEMREKIRNERRVELAFEDHRMWDVRRWMTAERDLNEPLYGVEITPGLISMKYEKIEVEKRVFEKKMYFYPIPQTMLSTEGVDCPQNPLW